MAQVKCGAGPGNGCSQNAHSGIFIKCHYKMPLKTNRIKFKVAVCGQYLGYDRSNGGLLVFLNCYFECIKMDASLICRP